MSCLLAAYRIKGLSKFKIRARADNNNPYALRDILLFPSLFQVFVIRPWAV
jgi:hypothetical protein